ncbi:class I SAM-dependent methyltransferase [uncultured Polaribacter sp.]|uniref:O-methyltransferase n=1 Tax=uncultured Polaribacter sp. TaxID=174711 RepID=UPI00262A1C20|nr:class I SAM-dependent methyltransferase [uncultured Polaribacter sp.]
MFFQQIEYLKFLLKSTNQHGVHSPFIFKFVTAGLYKKKSKKDWNSFRNIKNQLLKNKKTIEITDFGSGSKVFKNNNRQISKIAKIAGISNKKAKLLIKIVNYFIPITILEIGTSLGLGTSAMHIGHQDAKIRTLEGCAETSKIAKELFQNNHFKNIELITGNFQKTLPAAIQNKQFDLIYFDGNHTKKATLSYFKTCLTSIHNNSIFIFDDIYWSEEMTSAWNEIKKHPKVRVTVDVFYFGIVFFRKEQEKEHFKIRV